MSIKNQKAIEKLLEDFEAMERLLEDHNIYFNDIRLWVEKAVLKTKPMAFKSGLEIPNKEAMLEIIDEIDR